MRARGQGELLGGGYPGRQSQIFRTSSRENSILTQRPRGGTESTKHILQAVQDTLTRVHTLTLALSPPFVHTLRSIEWLTRVGWGVRWLLRQGVCGRRMPRCATQCSHPTCSGDTSRLNRCGALGVRRVLASTARCQMSGLQHSAQGSPYKSRWGGLVAEGRGSCAKHWMIRLCRRSI